eukprot:CAMPEP_0194403914 /NCGR_PEP_ID=MMETSP0176-20130528/2489_1 /TAXON_ID=216777 /ORGANISM="Proboscia alata, Strain PI-D3" /LENGTH=1001 /DNA_ID=CAMNT_0039201973 /DNA_START=121 /DNA_END=3126 /DNA_ORIENTATION=+
MAKRKRRKIKGDSKDSDVETPHKSEISRKSNSNSNKGTRTSKRQSIGSDEDASKSASSPVTRTRTRSKPNQPATRKSPRGQEPVPATPAAAKSDSKSSSKPSNRKLIDAIRYVEEASPKTISISSDDIPKFESKPDKPATRRSSRSREPSAPATPADPVKSNLISSSKPSSCKPIVNTKTKDVNKASETKSISDDDSPAKSKRNQSPTRRSSRGRQPSVPATADPAKPNSKSSNSKQGCEMSVDTEDVDEASDTESISDDIPAKSKPNQPPTRRSSRGKQPVPATTDTIESNLKSISKPSSCEMIDTEDVVEASDTKSMSGDNIPADSDSKPDKRPTRRSSRGKQPPATPAAAELNSKSNSKQDCKTIVDKDVEDVSPDPTKSNSKSNSEPNSKMIDADGNVEEASATPTPLQPRTPTTITLHISNPEQRLGLELYETKLRTQAHKTMLSPVVAIRSVLPNGLAADRTDGPKLCPGMMLLEYPTKADLVDRFRKGPYPIELRFLTVGVPSNILQKRVMKRMPKSKTYPTAQSRNVNINDTAWFESFDDEASPNPESISSDRSEKSSKLPNSKPSSKSIESDDIVAKSNSKSNSSKKVDLDSDAEDNFEYMDSDFDSDDDARKSVGNANVNGNTRKSPVDGDAENEGYGSERVSAGEMYVCELREELWKRGVNVTVGKEKKKELVRMLEQQWTEEASGKPNGRKIPLRNKPSPEVPVPSEFGIQRRKEKLALESEVADFLNTEDCWHPDVKDASVPKSLAKPISKPSSKSMDSDDQASLPRRPVRKVGRPRKQPTLTAEPPAKSAQSKSRSRSKSRSKRIESDSDDASDQSIFVEFSSKDIIKPKLKAIFDSDDDVELQSTSSDEPRTRNTRCTYKLIQPTLKSVRKVGRPPNKKQKSKAILDSDSDDDDALPESKTTDSDSDRSISKPKPGTLKPVRKVRQPPNKKHKSRTINSDSEVSDETFKSDSSSEHGGEEEEAKDTTKYCRVGKIVQRLLLPFMCI